MSSQALLQASRIVAAPLLALLQFWVLWGVCNSSTMLIGRMIRAELGVMEVFPSLARAAALTALFLLAAGRVWSWAARMDGSQAVMCFAVFGFTSTLLPLLVTRGLEGPSIPLALAIRFLLATGVTIAFYLGSKGSGFLRNRR